MIKTHLTLAIAVIALLLSSVSNAQAQTSRFYLAGYLGLNTFNDQEFTESASGNNGDFEIDNTMSFAGALGMRLSQQLRIEGELSYRNAEFSTADIAGVGTFSSGGELKSTLLFANMYYDFDVPWSIQPYIGGGLGYGWHSGEINDGSGLMVNASSDHTGIIWNAAAGIKYRPSPDMAFIAGYRYVDAVSDLEIGSYDVDFDTHEFRLGMEWDLPIR
ncbi:MAG: porin family protein [Rhodospirillales bacterium]|nr:porin family protein [Alphaproteobacteria bacterium]MCB9981516.1 porin family protein [Rhodospirillales bacterium]